MSRALQTRHADGVLPHCAALVAACALVLAACGSAPPAPQPPPADRPAPPDGATDAVSSFEAVQRERVASLEKQGRLADAAVVLEALALVRPDENRAALSELKRRIDTTASDRLQRARRELKKGDLDAAEQLYLSVLAVQPDQAEAGDALRGIDRSRNRRDYLSRPPRIAFARRPNGVSSQPSVARADAANGDPLEVEHASMLGNQGELDDAITMMERRLAGNANDLPARRALATLYFKKAQSLRGGDRGAATAAANRCLQLEPNHAGAKALLKQLTLVEAARPAASAAEPKPAAARR